MKRRERVIEDHNTIHDGPSIERNNKKNSVEKIGKKSQGSYRLRVGHDDHKNSSNHTQFSGGGGDPVRDGLTLGNNNSSKYKKIGAALEKSDRPKVIDELDLQLLNLLLRGFDNKQIAETTDNPLSTVQRRTRLIFERGFAASRVDIDYRRLGLKKGFLALRLTGGKIQSIVERLQGISGIIAISANIGIFPITCTIIYKDVTELWSIVSAIQELDNIREVLWSEEIYSYVSMQNNSSILT